MTDRQEVGGTGAGLGVSAARTREDFARLVLDSESRVLVRFWADWCVPCHAMAPVIERMARDHGLAVVGVDVGASAALASQHGVRSLPTVMLFEGGRLTGTAVGPMARARLTQQLGLADPLIVQLEGEVEHGAG